MIWHKHSIFGMLMHMCGYRITVIISVFQTDDAGPTPATRSRKILTVISGTGPIG